MLDSVAAIGALTGTLLLGCAAAPKRPAPPDDVTMGARVDAAAPVYYEMPGYDERGGAHAPRTVSLGFVGDATLGPTVHRSVPAWTRPFPSSWVAGGARRRR